MKKVKKTTKSVVRKKRTIQSGPRKSAATKPVERVSKRKRPTGKKVVSDINVTSKSTALVLWEAFAYECALVNSEILVMTKSNEKHGRPPFLFTPKNLAAVLLAYKKKEIEEVVAVIAGISVDTLVNVKKKSPTFNGLVSQAKTHFRRLGVDALEYKLVVVAPHFEEVTDKEGKTYFQFVKGREPSDQIVQWVLEHQAPEEFGRIELLDKDPRNSVLNAVVFIGEQADLFRQLSTNLSRYARNRQQQFASRN